MLLTAISGGKLIPRPDFQRRLVWTNSDKNEFIRTVLELYPFPEIYIASGDLNNETGEATELLVDGQQRVTTLHQYFKASEDLKLDKGIKPYAQLTDVEKEAFLEYEVVIRDLGKLPIEQVKLIFERINSANYALNTMEIQNARYGGAFKQFADGLVAEKFFSEGKIFTAAEVRRMQDVRFALTLVATIMSTYFNRDEMIEEYLELYNDVFEKAATLHAELLDIVRVIEVMNFPENCRVWKRADLFTLIVELHRIICKHKKTPDFAVTAQRLAEFYTKVDEASADESKIPKNVAIYYRATLQASNDRGSRIRRGEVLQGIIDPGYTPEPELLLEYQQ